MEKAFELAIPLIKSFEGFSFKRYKCSAGYDTIGYGHLIRDSEKIPPQITEKEAEELLLADLNISANALQKNCHVPLAPNQQAALLSFIFNLGGGAFQSSALRQKLNRQEYKNAANEFAKWCFAGGIMLKGLLRRRIAERDLFLNDAYVS